MNDIVDREQVAAELQAMYDRTSTDNQKVAMALTVLAMGALADEDLPPCSFPGGRANGRQRRERQAVHGCSGRPQHRYGLGPAPLTADPSGSMALVQCIILMSRYLANCKPPYEFGMFWISLGTAARCAQSVSAPLAPH
jgi:hypothetical protein